MHIRHWEYDIGPQLSVLARRYSTTTRANEAALRRLQSLRC